MDLLIMCQKDKWKGMNNVTRIIIKVLTSTSREAYVVRMFYVSCNTIIISNQVFNWNHTHSLFALGNLHYKISREKLEPEPGFEPRTSGFLARRSATWATLVFLLRSYNAKFPKAQTMGLVSINNLIWISYSCKTAKLVR